MIVWVEANDVMDAEANDKTYNCVHNGLKKLKKKYNLSSLLSKLLQQCR